jgi:hypothetical protein
MSASALSIALPIFDALGPNKVTHPIDICEQYEEGYITPVAVMKFPASQARPQPLSQSRQPKLQLQLQLGLLSNIMVWKTPSLTLLPPDRIAEETTKFKNELIKAASQIDSKIAKAHNFATADIIQYIINDAYENSLFEFLGFLWNCVFITATAVCGVNDITSETPIYKILPHNIETGDLEQFRQEKIRSQAQNLKNVKDYNDLLSSLKLSLTTVDTETNKRRALLKSELQQIVLSYSSRTTTSAKLT